jgi:hypothetical protein
MRGGYTRGCIVVCISNNTDRCSQISALFFPYEILVSKS